MAQHTTNQQTQEDSSSVLEQILLGGDQNMLQHAVEREVQQYLEMHNIC